jgi:hypothetical protein
MRPDTFVLGRFFCGKHEETYVEHNVTGRNSCAGQSDYPQALVQWNA